MNEFIQKIFESDFMPHGHCFFWQADVLWLHVISDAVIALAYFSIPFFLIYLVKKRKDLTFKYMFLLFGLFIFFCGTTHLMDIYTLWIPVYRVEGLVKAGTAFVSILTGIMLIPLLPVALKLPSPQMLREANAKLQVAKDELEDKVAERTAELSAYADELKNEITQRKVMQLQLEQTNRELKEFAYIVSHDLKSPIRAVGNLSDLLVIDQGDKLDEDGREHLFIIKQSAVRMEQLINSILQYSRIGNITSSPEIVKLSDMVEEIFQQFQTEKNVKLIIDNLPVFEAERMHLWQLFQNLIQNSIKYIDKPEGEIRIGSRTQDDQMIFYVTDNGIGIPEEYHEQVFKIFQTLNSGKSESSTGIGLAIVHKIVKMYGGEIWIESETDNFTTFNFTLPLLTDNITPI